MVSRVNLLKAKLKTARKEEKQWAKVYNQAERTMIRIGRKIDELERKINELERTKQGTAADA